jgi:Mo-dependent nitrogenase C-terminus
MLNFPLFLRVDILAPLRRYLEAIEIRDLQTAHFFCKYIPAQCPFARELKMGGHLFLRIPPLCKLNPLYEQVIGLRFKALTYLADACGENISAYI